MNVSPLHAALRGQLHYCIAPERAAPAIFLLAHDVFDAQALLAAALTYSKVATEGAGRLAQCLREEAHLRASHTTASPKIATPTAFPLEQSEGLAALVINLSERIDLCARIGGDSFNDDVRAAQKEVEALVLRLRRAQPSVPA